MTILFADVSYHDRVLRGAPLDWSAIFKVLAPIMMCRATYGDPSGFNPSSPYFLENCGNARRAGARAVGGYHNLIAGDAASINRQVDYFRRNLDAGGADHGMADCEPYDELRANGLWPRWSHIRAFHDRWYRLEHRICKWYIPRWFWSRPVSQVGLGSPDLRVLHGPWVQSHYAGGDGTPAQIYAAAGGDSGTGWDDAAGGRLPDEWQFTSKANVAGATNSTDVNAFRGTLARYLASIGVGDDTVTPAEFLAILRDPSVSAEMSRLPWAFRPATWGGDTSAHTIVLDGVGRGVPKLVAAAGQPMPVTLDDAQLSALADRVSAALADALNHPLSAADLDAIKGVVKAALREGVGS